MDDALRSYSTEYGLVGAARGIDFLEGYAIWLVLVSARLRSKSALRLYVARAASSGNLSDVESARLKVFVDRALPRYAQLGANSATRERVDATDLARLFASISSEADMAAYCLVLFTWLSAQRIGSLASTPETRADPRRAFLFENVRVLEGVGVVLDVHSSKTNHTGTIDPMQLGRNDTDEYLCPLRAWEAMLSVRRGWTHPQRERARLGYAFRRSPHEPITAVWLRGWLKEGPLRLSQLHSLRRGGADNAFARGGAAALDRLWTPGSRQPQVYLSFANRLAFLGSRP
jgi:hypothetical protein